MTLQTSSFQESSQVTTVQMEYTETCGYCLIFGDVITTIQNEPLILVTLTTLYVVRGHRTYQAMGSLRLTLKLVW